MKLKELREGDKIRINRVVYEVVKIVQEANYDSDSDSAKFYLEFQLHNLKSKALTPSKVLWWYKDTGEIVFADLLSDQQFKLDDEMIEAVKKPRQKG